MKLTLNEKIFSAIFFFVMIVMSLKLHSITPPVGMISLIFWVFVAIVVFYSERPIQIPRAKETEKKADEPVRIEVISINKVIAYNDCFYYIYGQEEEKATYIPEDSEIYCTLGEELAIIERSEKGKKSTFYLSPKSLKTLAEANCR